MDEQDTIRVLRVLEYVGPRDKIEKTLENSVHGTKRFGRLNECAIHAATIGIHPYVVHDENPLIKHAATIAEIVGYARIFCARVENGEVRSVRTYNDFKRALTTLENAGVIDAILSINHERIPES